MCWPYFSVLSYAFDPPQLSEVWHLIKRFSLFPPSICLTHFPFAFSRSHSFSASLRFFMNSSIPRWYLISKAEATEKPFSLAPFSLIVIKMWCYYLWMRCSTTFNSLLFLRPCIFCPTLSFPGEIWGGRGSSESFLFWLPLFVSHSLSLSLPPSFILSLTHNVTCTFFMKASATAREMK